MPIFLEKLKKIEVYFQDTNNSEIKLLKNILAYFKATRMTKEGIKNSKILKNNRRLKHIKAYFEETKSTKNN